ncbi:low temperature requirement protein A [Plantactinospora solaniradicis]|uniref:Low temperature requirement protein A n=1 Tax=Plantactinospora solaniradicis TaxID=1723736 RepID=A0ABW1K759_9ACTN
MAGQRPARLLRQREHSRQASFLELFFDLAFIVTLMTMSARLVRNLDWLNVGETAILFAAAWWVWVATAWSTDWYNPNEPIIRTLVLGVMFLGLLMAAAVPRAFGEHGLVFAGAYAAIHLGRAALLMPALRGHPVQRRTLLVAIWFGLSTIPWIVGALMSGTARLALWALAVVLDYASAALGWPVPRLGRLPSAQLRVIGEHLSGRYQQVFIVALGEIFLVMGMAYSRDRLDPVETVMFAVTFVNAGLLLWMYFVPASSRLGGAIEENQPRGAVLAAYCHAIMIAGTVLTAVGAEVMITHPLGETRAAWSAAIIGGTGLFLTGRILMSLLLWARYTWRSITGLLVLLASSPGLIRLPPLVVGIVTNVVLLAVVLAYTFRAEARQARAEQRRAAERRATERPVEERQVTERWAEEHREERRAEERRHTT